MKKNFLTVIMIGAVVSIAGFSACDNKPDDAKETAEAINDEVKDDRKSENDAQFLVDAADLNLMEIHMGELGSTSATMQEVKDFSKKMQTDHQQAFDEMVALASTKNITIPSTPSDEAMKHHKDLAEKKGYDFDRELMDKMVDGHEKAIKKFEDAADDAQDPDIKAWASKMLPTLRAHLEEAKMLKDKVKEMK